MHRKRSFEDGRKETHVREEGMKWKNGGRLSYLLILLPSGDDPRPTALRRSAQRLHRFCASYDTSMQAEDTESFRQIVAESSLRPLRHKRFREKKVLDLKLE